MRINAPRFLALVVGGLLVGPGSASAGLINGVAVIVNDKIITYQDVMLSIAPTLDLLRAQYSHRPEVLEEKVKEVQREGTQQLIERELILHDFKASGFVIPEAVIDGMMEDRIRDDFGNRARMARTLQERGTTIEAYRQKLREQVIIRALTDRNVPHSPVISPHKIEKYYQSHQEDFRTEEQVKLRMIVINKAGDGSSDIARTRIKEIIQKIRDGATFAEMAAVYSEGSQQSQGGDWGWVDKYNAVGAPVLREELFDVAFSLKPGEVSDAIETPTAYYLMLVEDKRPNQVKPLAEVWDTIEQELVRQERARHRQRWIERLKAKSFIGYF